MSCQSNPVQLELDLFGGSNDKPPPAPAGEPALNGMYYERSTGLYVSYVQGRRYFEVTSARCLGDKAWKERIKKERSI
ncbi:hypothetical protein [Paenibacillus bouchesdurhonensis]|uniref:hypothetical protein n=1 Tax=Paenibacillus bouchesdurhonensis TaxID=1870990 RepID=UPI001F4715D7|nr:hypothetical protein [Paenibacillus bouchesdurhonensis]